MGEEDGIRWGLGGEEKEEDGRKERWVKTRKEKMGENICQMIEIQQIHYKTQNAPT